MTEITGEAPRREGETGEGEIGEAVAPGGTPEEPETSDDEFSMRVLESMWEVFWEPEIERRGGIDVTGPIRKALAVLSPGEPTVVLLNDEFEMHARAKVRSAIQRGDPVTADNIDDLEALEPVGVDPNAGWVAWLVLPDGRQFTSFDFHRNRARSLHLLDLARDYLATAEHAHVAERVGPALENAMAAAELAITAQTYSFSTDVPDVGGRRNLHSARRHWTKVQVGLGNTTPDAHTTLMALHEARAAARYGEGGLPDRARVGELVVSVAILVEDVAQRVGVPLRTQDPAFLAKLTEDPGAKGSRSSADTSREARLGDR